MLGTMTRLRLPAALAAFCLLPLLGGCNMVVLDPAGDVAQQQGNLVVISTLLMLIIIVPVMALTGYFAWKYRAANETATYKPDWDHSTQLELAIWAIPLLIIICLGAVTWVGGDMDFAFGGTTQDLFDSLVEVDGSIRIVGALFNPDLGNFGASNFPMLTTVHGDFTVASSTVITVPGVTNQFPALSTVDGTFDIDAGGITELLVGSPSGMEVGNLRLHQNFGLSDLAVSHVDVSNLGTIEITNNVNLGDCEADAFVDAQAAMGWMGTSIVSDNGPC